MEENNVETNTPEAQFGGHPSQAHQDHAHIMKAHAIIQDPGRMAAVHALHQQSGGLMNYLKKKQKDFAAKSAAPGGAPVSGPSEPVTPTGASEEAGE